MPGSCFTKCRSISHRVEPMTPGNLDPRHQRLSARIWRTESPQGPGRWPRATPLAIARRLRVPSCHCAPSPHRQPSSAARCCTASTLLVFEVADGWAWVQMTRDDYVGYVPADALSRDVRGADPPRRAPSARLSIPSADIKAPPVMHLSLGSELVVETYDDRFARLGAGRFVIARHITPSRSGTRATSSRSQSGSSVPLSLGRADPHRPRLLGSGPTLARSRRVSLPPRQRHAAGDTRRRSAWSRRLSMASSAAIWCSGRPCRDHGRQRHSDARQCPSHGGRRRAAGNRRSADCRQRWPDHGSKAAGPARWMRAGAL